MPASVPFLSSVPRLVVVVSTRNRPRPCIRLCKAHHVTCLPCCRHFRHFHYHHHHCHDSLSCQVPTLCLSPIGWRYLQDNDHSFRLCRYYEMCVCLPLCHYWQISSLTLVSNYLRPKRFFFVICCTSTLSCYIDKYIFHLLRSFISCRKILDFRINNLIFTLCVSSMFNDLFVRRSILCDHRLQRFRSQQGRYHIRSQPRSCQLQI